MQSSAGLRKFAQISYCFICLRTPVTTAVGCCDNSDARVDADESENPPTTLSIVRAILVDGRRVIGLHIDEKNVSYVCSELRRQHAAGWHDQCVDEVHAIEGWPGAIDLA